MHFVLVSSLAGWLLAARTAASGPTKIFIDQVPEYRLLQSCAVQQVSAVVRGMSWGCGDDSQMTSFACFCSQSSAYYSRMISTRVTSACSKSHGPESSALEVFDKYCSLADKENVAITSDSTSSDSTSSASSTQSTTASPVPNPAVTTPTPTGTPGSQTSGPPEPANHKKDHTAAIAAGVTVPVVVIAIGLVGLWLYLHQRKRPPPSELAGGPESQATEISGTPLAHEKDTYRPYELESGRPQELGVGGMRQELPASTPDADRDRKIERLLTNGGS